MHIAADLIELKTNDADKVVRLSTVEKYPDGSGYRCELFVLSTGFSCDRPFYFDDVALSFAAPELQKMAAGTPGKVIIKGEYEEDFLEIRSNVKGHVWVSGEICEHSESDQRLKFRFRTDQTILLPLARDLLRLQDA